MILTGFWQVLLAVPLGFLLDFLFGDPRKVPHVVCGIGFLIAKGETFLRRFASRIFFRSPIRERMAGTILTFLVVFITAAFSFGILFLARSVNPWCGLVVETAMCWQALAARSLKSESMKVYEQVIRGDLIKARHAVSMIVGRDTNHLSLEQVTKATVETIAENLSDGVIAPLFFMALGGGPLALCYKAVNTLDSMIGYKNDRYLQFGRTAAKLDDVVNWIPARLSAWLLIFVSFVAGYNVRETVRIYRRDRDQHASPNSAHTEAVMAGALGVQLAGNAYYFGELYEKPTIGDAHRPICAEDIRLTNRLMYAASWFGLGIAFLCRALCWMLFITFFL